jgi:hypothetical protein
MQTCSQLQEGITKGKIEDATNLEVERVFHGDQVVFVAYQDQNL